MSINIAANATISATVGLVSYTGSVSGTTLTSSATTGTIAIGQAVYAATVLPGTIIAAGSGTSWTVNISQTVASCPMTNRGTTYQLAAATYYGQNWNPNPYDIYLGAPDGTTTLSGAWKITSWSGSGSTWKATTGTWDGATGAALPTANTSAVFTASLNTTSGGQMVVTAITSGTISPTTNTMAYNAAGTIAAGTFITGQVSGTAGGVGTYSISVSQTVGSGTVYATQAQYATYVSNTAPLVEDLWVAGTRYTRVAAPGPAAAGTWWLNPADNSVNVNANLTGTLVEYTPSSIAVITYAGNLNQPGVTFSNIIFEKFATQGPFGCILAADHYTFTNCTFRYCHGGGIHLGSGNNLINCFATGNGCVGVVGSGANNTVNGCEISFNNALGFSPRWAAGGLKLTSSTNAIVTNNIVHDNAGPGVWGDIESSGWLVANNRIYNQTAYGSQNDGVGLFYEISYGGRFYGNYIYNNSSSGIYIANSPGCQVYANTIVVGLTNSTSDQAGAGGIDIINDIRGNGSDGLPYQAVNNAIHDNVVIHTTDTSQDGFFCYQIISTPTNANNTWQNNLYITSNATSSWWNFDVQNSASGGSHPFTWTTLQAAGTYETTGGNSVPLPFSNQNIHFQLLNLVL